MSVSNRRSNNRDFARHDRVAGLLRRELGVLVQRELNDPDIGFVSISDVVVTRDLSVAKIYVSVLNSETADLSIAALNRSTGYLRSILGKQLRMRTSPELRFMQDTSIEVGEQMDALLASVLPRKQSSEEE